MSENNLERPNYYAVVPADVRYSEQLSANAKLLYGEITALANKTGTCWASNVYFAKLYGVKERAVTDWVAQLVAAGFVTTKVNKAESNRRYIRLVTVPIVKNHYSSSEKALDNNKTNSNHSVKLQNSLLALVNEITGRSFRTLPDRGVKKTLDAFSLDEIRAALTALADDEWHKERIKTFKIDYLIRSTTIDKFLGEAAPVVKKKTDAEMLAEQEERNKLAASKDFGLD